MKKIAFLISLLAICLCRQSSAQFLIGPQAGINFATLTGTSFSIKTKPGWHVGTFVSIPFSKHFSLMPALLYVVDGYEYDYTSTTTPNKDSTFTVVADVNATLGYLDLPVLLNYFAGETKGLMIQAGLQLSVLVTDNSKITTTVSINGGDPQPSQPTDENQVKVNKSEVSIVGGLGYKFSQLVIVYARAVSGLAQAQDGGFVTDENAGHNFSYEAGIALSFGAK